MTVTAAKVQELRERTGAGLMDCKKVLVTVGGDIDAAIEAMRKAGQTKADKKSDRVTAEGVITVKVDASGKVGVIIETNCETDFVARDADFKHFVDAVADAALKHKTKQLPDVMTLTLSDGLTVEQARQALVAKIGENIQIRRYELIESPVQLASYVHGGRIGVLVELDAKEAQLGKDIAMQIAANHPVVVHREEVSKDLLAKEKEIFMAQAESSGKPAAVIEKMVEGRLKKFLDEVSLMGQPFVKNPEMTIEQLLKQSQSSVKSFIRYAVGEGIEKKANNFAEEVMAQVRGN